MELSKHLEATYFGLLERCILTWGQTKSVKIWCEVCLCRKTKWHRNTKSKEKQGSRQKHSHRLRTTCSAREQNAGLGRGDDRGRLQTDPVVDFPKHCILLHSFFINIEGVTEKRNPKEVTVFIWVICFARGGKQTVWRVRRTTGWRGRKRKQRDAPSRSVCQ